MTPRELVARTAIVLGLIALAWIIAWFVSHIAGILILLLFSVILAAGLAPLVGLLERRRLPGGTRLARGVAIFVIYLVMFAVIAGIVSAITVPAVHETAAFMQNFPQFLAQLKVWLANVHQRFPWLPNLVGTLNQLPQALSAIGKYGPTAAGVAFKFAGGIGTAIAVLVFTFYMLLEGAQIKRSFLALFPPEERPRVDRVLRRIGLKFGGWLRGQLLLSFTIAMIVAIGLLILGMPFPFLLGIIAGIGELIPMVGPSIGAAAGILVALTQPFWRLIGVVALYVIVMNVEPHYLAPRIMKRAVGMSPLLTIVALLAGIQLMGVLGGLLAVPVAAAIQVIASEVASELQPGEPPPETAPPEEQVAAGARRPEEPVPPAARRR